MAQVGEGSWNTVIAARDQFGGRRGVVVASASLMKLAFYTGIAFLILFELANVYFIMPMPLSQRWESVGFAYTLYAWRWPLRAVAATLIAAGIAKGVGWGRQKWIAGLCVLTAAASIYAANFVLAADAMFL